MQLKLAFLDPPDLAPNPSPAAPSATAWRQLDSLANRGARDSRTSHRPHAVGRIDEGGKQ